MDEDKEKKDECKMTPTDSEGNANLCCCFIIDQEGRYQDPCPIPVNQCC